MTSTNTPTVQLVADSELPSWFKYPDDFLRVVASGLYKFPPWKILEGEYAASRMSALRKRFPGSDLVPFALRLDCDDVACWERGKESKVVIIHDFASPGWERRAEFETFWEWFRSAIEDFVEFEP